MNTFPSFMSVYIEMRNTYEKNGVIFGQCKKCSNFFHMDEKFWYKSKTGFMGFSSICKICDTKRRKGYKKNNEVSKRANKKYYEAHKQKILENNHNRGKEKGYDKIHKTTQRKIKRLGIKPDICPICNQTNIRIVAHHPDYNNKNLIVFCCDSCHRNIHNGNIKCPPGIEI